MNKYPKLSQKIKYLAGPAAAIFILAFLPGRAGVAQAQGALCGMVETNSPYFQQYCQNWMTSGSNYSGSYNAPNPNYMNQNYYGQNYYNYNMPNSGCGSSGYNSMCAVVETSSPYYQQYCRSYSSGSSYPNTSSTYYPSHSYSYNYPSQSSYSSSQSSSYSYNYQNYNYANPSYQNYPSTATHYPKYTYTYRSCYCPPYSYYYSC